MASTLRYLGLAALALAAWLFVAEAADWISPTSGQWSVQLAWGGVVSIAAGVVVGLLSRAARPLTRGRCARCGRGIESRQSYCLDHLQETVNEYRDAARRG